MVNEVLNKLQGVVNTHITEMNKRVAKLSQKMNEDYDWFFRYKASEMFILNLEIKELKILAEELLPNNVNAMGGLEKFFHYYHNHYSQKLLCEPFSTNTNFPMFNLAYMHERTVWQNMYRILNQLMKVAKYSTTENENQGEG